MKTDVQNLSATRVKIVVEVPFEELADDLKTAYRTIGSQVNVPGFRKGKVPARVIDQRFGRGSVLSEVANLVIPRAYREVVDEHQLVPLAEPDVEVTKLEDGELMEFVAEVDVRPQFDLPELSSLSVEVDAVKGSEALVDEELEALRKRFASFNPVERAAQDGDVVLIDVKASDADGAEAEAYTAQALSFEVGGTEPIDGFNDLLRGAEAGAELALTHTPEEGPDAGKELQVEVALTAVRERILPELDDEFAQLASEFDTLAELREDLAKRAGRYQLLEQGQQVRTKVLEALLAAVELELPENLIEQQLQEHFHDGHGDEAHRAETQEELRSNLKTQLVLDKLSEQEDLSVSEQELSQWLMAQAPRYGMTADQFAQALVEGGQVQMALAEVRRSKALSLALEAATITDSNGEPVVLEEITQQLTMASLLQQISELQPDDDDFDDLLEEELEEVLDEIDEALDEAEAELAEELDGEDEPGTGA